MNFPDNVQIAMYRVAQESLNNVSRHARATKVWLRLVCNDQQATLTISDDGCGFDVAESTSGMGLEIMRERIEAIGGDFELHSESRVGTIITVHWNDQSRNQGDDDN
jgi:signal transduction histidine kinase